MYKMPRSVAGTPGRALMMVAVVAITLSSSAAAQASGVSSAAIARNTFISGVVTGPNGAALAGAVVEVRSNKTAQIRGAVTNDAGKYLVVSSDSGTTFRVTVRATDHLPWVGDVSRSMTSDRITLNVTLKDGGTAADWPPPPDATPALKFARSQLGTADAIDVTIGSGDIQITGSSTKHIIYQAYEGSMVGLGPTLITSEGPGAFGLSRASSRMTIPVEIAPAASYAFGPGGLSIAGVDGTSLMLEVPSDLKGMKVTITNHGSIRVSGFNGELTVQSASGAIDLVRVAGPTVVEARNGDISVYSASIPAAMNLLGRNGSVTVSAPTDTRASFTAEVHGGTITLDSTSHIVYPTSPVKLADVESFRVGAPGPDPASKLPWIMNGGGAAITVTSLNGNIIIRKNNPPKQE